MKTLLVASPFANLGSISRALTHVGAEVDLSADPATIANAEKIVLPGVGSFAFAMQWLEGSGVAAALRQAVSRGSRLLGICLGFQLLFESSEEGAEGGRTSVRPVSTTPSAHSHPERSEGSQDARVSNSEILRFAQDDTGRQAAGVRASAGLRFVEGHVRRFSTSLPVPAIGWNSVTSNGSALFRGIESGSEFYFVHSYRAVAGAAETATASYGDAFTAAVEQRNVSGVQFHPEKSSAAGLRVLRNFVEMR